MFGLFKAKPLDINHDIPPFGVTEFMRVPVPHCHQWAGTNSYRVPANERPRSIAGFHRRADGSVVAYAKRTGEFDAARYGTEVRPGPHGTWLDDSNPAWEGREPDEFQLMDARAVTWRAFKQAGIDVRR